MSNLEHLWPRTLIGLCLLPLASLAQTAAPTEFPQDAHAGSPETLGPQLSGKVFHVKTADGGGFRIEYRANGYVYLDMSTGFRDSGKWRIEGSTICAEWRQIRASCSEARLRGDTVFVKRANNGEIVALSSP